MTHRWRQDILRHSIPFQHVNRCFAAGWLAVNISSISVVLLHSVGNRQRCDIQGVFWVGNSLAPVLTSTPVSSSLYNWEWAIIPGGGQVLGVPGGLVVIRSGLVYVELLLGGFCALDIYSGGKRLCPTGSSVREYGQLTKYSRYCYFGSS